MSSLTGLSPNNPRDYVGPNVALNTVVTRNRAPTGADYRQPETGKLYPFNTFWLVGKNPTVGTQGDLWYLSKIVANVAYWIMLNAGSATSLSVMVQANTPPGTNPVIPTMGGLININGAIVANHSVPIETRSRAINTFNVEVQYAAAAPVTTANLSGLAHFNNSDFAVDASGFVSLNGSGIISFVVDDSTAPGTNPVVPTVPGVVTITGGQVAAGTTANVIQTDSLAANTFTIEVQRASDEAVATVGANGVSHFDSAYFTVDADGFVSVNGSGIGSTITGDSGGALSPTAGNWNILGASTAAGTTPVSTSGAVSTLTVNIQKSQAIAAADATKVGLSAFDSSAFDVDADGFVTLNGGGIASTSFTVQAVTGPGVNPVVPTAMGIVTVNGAAVANHSVVLETRSRAVNAYNVEIQYATTAAATDATKSGVAHFDSTDFAVDANGFVTLAGAGAGQTLTGNTGGALPPSSGNWNILGGSGIAGTTPVQVNGAGSTLTVNVQKSQAIAATDATKVGLANFDSSMFSVDANGFVGLNFATNSWTPTIFFNGFSTGVTYDNQFGYYNKIGNIVYFFYAVKLTSKGSSVGAAELHGFPFTTINASSNLGYFFYTTSVVTFPAGGTAGSLVLPVNSSIFSLNYSTNTSATAGPLTNTNFANTSQIFGSGWVAVQ